MEVRIKSQFTKFKQESIFWQIHSSKLLHLVNHPNKLLKRKWIRVIIQRATKVELYTTYTSLHKAQPKTKVKEHFVSLSIETWPKIRKIKKTDLNSNG